MSRDGKVAAIDVIDQGGEGQQRDYRARTAATLVVSLERQVLSVDILSACRGTGKQLLVSGRGIRPAVLMEIDKPARGGAAAESFWELRDSEVRKKNPEGT